jgi:TonB family protein
MSRRYAASALIALCTGAVAAQTPASDSTARCDSIVAAARVDSVPTGLYFTVDRIDGLDLIPGQAQVIATAVATAFVPPVPFQVRVFGGTGQMPRVRRVRADTSTQKRAPSVIGVYRFTTTKTVAIAHAETVRASLVTGLDSAVMTAIREASIIKEVVELPPDEDSMRVQIRVSTDSGPGSRRALTVNLPRMPVVDAVPFRDNPAPIFPAVARGDSAEEVLLRFVVDPSGIPNQATVELARGRKAAFVRAALEALMAQQFSPATVGGCAVSQVVYYPFSFAAPPEKTPPRH